MATAPFAWVAPSLSAWALMAFVALLGSLGQLALIQALEYTEAAVLQPFSYTLLVWVALLGWLVFGDTPAPWTYVGGAMVVGSGLFAWWQERQPAPAAV